MSLILEALRKSEAERRRGQVPDLHAAPSPGAQPLRDGPPARLWAALALGAAVLLAIALWLARDAAPQPSPTVDVPVAATAVTRGRSADPDMDAGPGHGPDGTFALPATALEQAVADAIPEPPRRLSDSAQIPAAGSAAAASTPPARAPDTARVTGPVAPPVALALKPVGPPMPAPPVAPAPARPTLPAPLAPPGAAGTPDAIAGSAPLRLSDLSVAQRQQLPPLKVSMHMYSATQRFAIIDGARVAQGDRIGDAVVEDITANGVVLDWQGLRLQIPIR